MYLIPFDDHDHPRQDLDKTIAPSDTSSVKFKRPVSAQKDSGGYWSLVITKRWHDRHKRYSMDM